ncbi:regulator [Frankia sp. AgB1.9]|nr:regulator [Frankia sp. AgW1.1]MBL7548805.1 regulator [Frankia sp. AgB1.9]MBL7621974.1 regulator [Frankia sp. AgB1.8]
MRRTRGGSGGDAAPLPQRVPKPVPPPRHPVTCLDDPDLLTRVADRLRALDERRLAGLGRLN